MPHLMPGAVWRPIPRNFTASKRASTTAVILHVDAGDAKSLYGWFSQAAAGASSTFFVKKNGTIEQYVDLDHTDWCTRQGRHRGIGVETQGLASGAWTEAQLEALAKIVAFAHAEYGIPLRLMASSATSEHGIGWHRLGVDKGKWSTGTGWRKPGTESWSGAAGKVCPGPDRERQIPEVLARAQRMAGAPSKPASPATYPVPPKQWPYPLPAGHWYGQDDKTTRSHSGQSAIDEHNVKRIQWVCGLPLAQQDGAFGPTTEARVRARQKAAGITVDGRVGPQAWKAFKL